MIQNDDDSCRRANDECDELIKHIAHYWVDHHASWSQLWTILDQVEDLAEKKGLAHDAFPTSEGL